MNVKWCWRFTRINPKFPSILHTVINPLIPSVNGGKGVCEQPYLKQGHVLLVVLLALLGGCIAAVDEGAALLRVTVTCEKQTPPVRRLTHWSHLVLHLLTVSRVRRGAQLARGRTRRNMTVVRFFFLRNTRQVKGADMTAVHLRRRHRWSASLPAILTGG